MEFNARMFYGDGELSSFEHGKIYKHNGIKYRCVIGAGRPTDPQPYYPCCKD